MKRLGSIQELSREDIEEILNLAKYIEENPLKFSKSLEDKHLAIAFFEPSTRTRIGFSVAMQKLGGKVVELTEDKFKQGMSSAESTKDTLRILKDYNDLTALRHSSSDLVKSLYYPIINCGNGIDEHPTQTLLDLYYIWRYFGKIDGISINIIGDLKNTRASHSLVLALSKFKDVNVKLTSPNSLKMPSEYKLIDTEEQKNFNIGPEDVIYMAGFAPIKDNPEASDENRLKYQMNIEKLDSLKEESIIMNPLPRVDEITLEVDSDKRAKYFDQSKKGLFVRMAILKKILED